MGIQIRKVHYEFTVNRLVRLFHRTIPRLICVRVPLVMLAIVCQSLLAAEEKRPNLCKAEPSYSLTKDSILVGELDTFPQPFSVVPTWRFPQKLDIPQTGYQLELSGLGIQKNNSESDPVFWTVTEKGPYLVRFIFSADKESPLHKVAAFPIVKNKEFEAIDIISDCADHLLFAVTEKGKLFTWKLQNEQLKKADSVSLDLLSNFSLSGLIKDYDIEKASEERGWEGIAVESGANHTLWTINEKAKCFVNGGNRYGSVLVRLLAKNDSVDVDLWMIDIDRILAKELEKFNGRKKYLRACALELDTSGRLWLLAGWYKNKHSQGHHWLLEIDTNCLLSSNTKVKELVKQQNFEKEFTPEGMEWVRKNIKKPVINCFDPIVRLVGKVPEIRKKEGGNGKGEEGKDNKGEEGKDNYVNINWEGLAIQTVGEEKFVYLISDNADSDEWWNKVLPPVNKKKTYFLRLRATLKPVDTVTNN